MSTDLLTLDTGQKRASSVWDYISPSRLNCWITCPLRFRLRYIDGIRTPTTAALFLGKRVHAALEHYYRHRMLGIALAPDEIVHQIDETWDAAVAEESMVFESAAADATLRGQAAGLVQTYLEQVDEDESPPLAVEATMEVPLIDPRTGEDLGIPLLGITDLVLQCPDGAEIVDFKTSSRSAPPFEITHEIQLTCYALLFRQTTGREEAGLEIRSLIKTKQPKVEHHRYPRRDDRHFGRLLAVIREYLDALDCGRFNYRPGWGCSMCDFQGTYCREWNG